MLNCTFNDAESISSSLNVIPAEYAPSCALVQQDPEALPQNCLEVGNDGEDVLPRQNNCLRCLRCQANIQEDKENRSQEK